MRNPGTVVEGYRIEVLGETPDQGPPAWAQVYPPELRVFPKETGTAMIVFAPPPAGATAGGKFAFGVRVASSLDNERTAVAEGDLEVGRVFGLQATLTPVTSTGRWRGYHVIKYTNWGNTPVRLRLKASDPDERLGFFLRPDEIELPLGGKAEARLTVRTRKPFLRGQQTRLPFEVAGVQDGVPQKQPAHPMVSDSSRPVVNGAFMQKPIIGKAVAVLVALAVVAVAGAVVLALKQPKSGPSFGGPGSPDPPASVTAKATKDGKIQVNWAAAHAVDSYKVLIRQGSAIVGTPTVDGQQTQFVTTPLAPSTKYCFNLESLRGKNASGDSPQACATTTAAPASSKPTSPAGGSGSGTTAVGGLGGGGGGSGSGGSGNPSQSGAQSGGASVAAIKPGEWIVVFAVFPDGPAGKQKAADALAALSSSFGPSMLNSSAYPNWIYRGQPFIHPIWAVYVDTKTLDATNQLLAQCKDRGFTCVSTQPAGAG